jgi:signal peptidase I
MEETSGKKQDSANHKNESFGKTVLIYVHDLAYLVAVMMVIFLLFFRVVVVSGNSMKESLHNGDYVLLLSNVFYKNPQAGDIIVASKDSFENGIPIVKRVIAVEGQTVDIDFENNIVYVDGKPIDEPYLEYSDINREGISFPLKVEEGCVFVLGDNRPDSCDSRNPRVGLIDKREILGKAIFLFLPGQDPATKDRDLSRIGGMK